MVKGALHSLLFVLSGLFCAIALHAVFAASAQSLPPRLIASDDTISARVLAIEETWQSQYRDHYGIETPTPSLTSSEIHETLARLSNETTNNFALIYVFPHPDELELVALTPYQDSVRFTFPEVPQSVLVPVIETLRFETTRPISLGHDSGAGTQLYNWIIQPLEASLSEWNVDTLVFCVGAGVRTLPIAALFDGQQFLVEKYAVSIIPAFSLINHDYEPVVRAQVLAMGASQFRRLNALPAVPIELSAIVQDGWSGDVFLNEQFTATNLQQQLDQETHAIVHLATHATFKQGVPSESYIQLWDNERINLDDLAELGWSDRPVELLILSACQTALGDPQAELGFAGLSYHAGVNSTLASLWQVSDIGTLALMREVYWQLAQPEVKTKAEALRRAQNAMIDGTVYLDNERLYNSVGSLLLPEELVKFAQVDLSHPYYWSGFTLVGSPW